MKFFLEASPASVVVWSTKHRSALSMRSLSLIALGGEVSDGSMACCNWAGDVVNVGRKDVSGCGLTTRWMVAGLIFATEMSAAAGGDLRRRLFGEGNSPFNESSKNFLGQTMSNRPEQTSIFPLDQSVDCKQPNAFRFPKCFLKTLLSVDE